jgi:hypothetical protein
MAEYAVSHWRSVKSLQDTRISRLAGRLKKPILYHALSLRPPGSRERPFTEGQLRPGSGVAAFEKDGDKKTEKS